MQQKLWEQARTWATFRPEHMSWFISKDWLINIWLGLGVHTWYAGVGLYLSSCLWIHSLWGCPLMSQLLLHDGAGSEWVFDKYLLNE